MSNWTSIFIGVIAVIAILFYFFIKKVPHGWVQFRTGLVLRFLPALDSQPVVKLRDSLEAFVAKKLPGVKRNLPVDDVRDISISTRHGDIKARVFQSLNPKGSHIMVYMHGGGFCIGSLNTYEEVCRRLSRETGLSVVSLDYSLAPEHKFPRAHEECVDAVKWLVNHSEEIDRAPKPLVLAGDSAGGNLIISTYYESEAEVARHIEKMVAVYPVVDSKKSDYPSSVDYANGYYLTQKAMAQFTGALVPDQSDADDMRLSPIYETRTDFPETFILTAEFDPLRDQGEAFAEKLKKNGIKVVSKRYKSTIHAFFGLKDFGSQGVNAITDIDRFLKGQPLLNQ